MRIGIVGSGIAGLAAAASLTEAGHLITLFERQPNPGMDAHSVPINLEGRQAVADVPSRMFNRQQWPNLMALYERAGIEFEPVDSTQSFSFEGQPVFFKARLPYRIIQQPANLVNSAGRRTLAEISRLFKRGSDDLNKGLSDDVTLSEYLDQRKIDDEFVNGFLYPVLSSTVCTCSYASLDSYPAVIILETLEKLATNMPLYKTCRGTLDVVDRLTAGLDEIRLQCTVETIEEHHSHVRVTSSTEDGVSQDDKFDHLILAVQANHVATLMPQLTDEERAIFDLFSYESVAVSVHTDASVLPDRHRDWATFNFVACQESKRSDCHVLLNRFHSDWSIERPVIQTIGAIHAYDKNKTLNEIVLQRPVVTERSLEALKQLERLHDNPSRRIWYCGSYSKRGVPLLETAVQSAMDVVERLNVGSII